MQPRIGDTKQTPATPEELERLLRIGIGGRRNTRRNQIASKKRRNR